MTFLLCYVAISLLIGTLMAMDITSATPRDSRQIRTWIGVFLVFAIIWPFAVISMLWTERRRK